MRLQNYPQQRESNSKTCASEFDTLLLSYPQVCPIR